MHRALLASLWALAGCTGSIGLTPDASTPVPDMTVVAEAPVDGHRPTRVEEGAWTLPVALWLQDGAVAVADGEQVKRREGTAFVDVPVGAPGEASTLGAVRTVARRGAGVVVAAQDGFFHDAAGRLLRSPLSDAFAMDAVRFVQVTRGAKEALWVTTAAEALVVVDGRREALRVDDAEEPGAVQALAGVDEAHAVLVQGRSVYAVDLAAGRVTTLARGVGQVTALDALADGTVLFGTDEGMLRVDGTGVVTRETFAAEGEPAQAVVDVEVSGGLTLVTTARQVLQVTADAPRVLADVTAPRPNALARDAAGDAWLLDDGRLVRLTTSSEPTPVSFAADVQPFFAAHCSGCHRTGANYAPVFDLERYAVAKAYAARSVARLADTLAPMPPASAEVLTPAQYDVVVRWVDGGMLP